MKSSTFELGLILHVNAISKRVHVVWPKVAFSLFDSFRSNGLNHHAALFGTENFDVMVTWRQHFWTLSRHVSALYKFANNPIYYPTALRRIQITPKASTNVMRCLYSTGPLRQVFSQSASLELNWSYEKNFCLSKLIPFLVFSWQES